MKTRNKLVALALTAAMATTMFAGCGSKEEAAPAADSAASSAAEETAEATDGDSYEITFILSLRDEFLSALEKGANDNCPANVKLTTQDAQNDAAKQQQMIESARNAENDAIIVNLVDPASAASMLESAGDIPVVFVNRFPTDEGVLDPAKCVYVGSDEMTSGKFQGEFLVDYFNEKGQTDITYVMIQGTLGQTSTTNRTASAKQALADGGLNATLKGAELAGEYDRATAIEVFSPLISTGEVDFDCVISNNDAMALGVIEAMEQKSLDPGMIPIVGIDATADGRQAIKDGKLAMSVFQDPNGQGKGAIMAAVNMIKGTPLNEGTDFEVSTENPAIVWVPFEPVTPDNVADYDNR